MIPSTIPLVREKAENGVFRPPPRETTEVQQTVRIEHQSKLHRFDATGGEHEVDLGIPIEPRATPFRRAGGTFVARDFCPAQDNY